MADQDASTAFVFQHIDSFKLVVVVTLDHLRTVDTSRSLLHPLQSPHLLTSPSPLLPPSWDHQPSPSPMDPTINPDRPRLPHPTIPHPMLHPIPHILGKYNKPPHLLFLDHCGIDEDPGRVHLDEIGWVEVPELVLPSSVI